LDRRSSGRDSRGKPAIISIGAGNSQLPLIVTAKKMGWAVLAVDREQDAPGFLYADVRINTSTHDTQSILLELGKLANNYKFRGVVARTTATEALLTAVAISKDFGLPGLNKELVEISTTKSKLRRFCGLFNIPMPTGTDVSDLKELEHLDYPSIVKPDRTLVGKAEIYLCKNRQQLTTRFEDTLRLSANKRMEIQHFIDGIDATCLCWAHKGVPRALAWWDELVGVDTENRVVGIGVSAPSVIADTHVAKKAEAIIRQLTSYFPDVSALLLVSFRVTMEGAPYVIEIHADLGGDLIADVLLPNANTEFDFFELAIKVATGNTELLSLIDFRPATLYYQRYSPDTFEDYYVSLGQTVRDNLNQIHEVVGSMGLSLSIWPRHLEWLDLHNSR